MPLVLRKHRLTSYSASLDDGGDETALGFASADSEFNAGIWWFDVDIAKYSTPIRYLLDRYGGRLTENASFCRLSDYVRWLGILTDDDRTCTKEIERRGGRGKDTRSKHDGEDSPRVSKFAARVR